VTDAEVLAAIRANHLKANIAYHESGESEGTPRWDKAWVDPGGVLWGPGPYAKVPIDFGDPNWNIVVRVYPPERLRKRLAGAWKR
jgi:hypothetical protein